MAYTATKKMVLDALAERALPATNNWTYTDQRNAAIERIYALHWIIQWFDKTMQSTASQFQVKSIRGIATFSPTSTGQVLFDNMSQIATELHAVGSSYQFDPRIELLKRALYSRLAYFWNPSNLYQMRISDPYGLTDALNGIIEQVRSQGKSAKFQRTLRNHDQFINMRFKGFWEYLKSIAMDHPEARTIRLELQTGQSPAIWNRQQTMEYDVLHQRVSTWLTEIKNTYGNGIVGEAWKLDTCLSTGAFAHVLLISEGQTEYEHVQLKKGLQEIWANVNAGQGYAMDPCSLGEGCHYRASGRSYWAHLSLRDELFAAAIYFAKTDAILRYVPQGKPDPFGYAH